MENNSYLLKLNQYQKAIDNIKERIDVIQINDRKQLKVFNQFLKSVVSYEQKLTVILAKFYHEEINNIIKHYKPSKFISFTNYELISFLKEIELLYKKYDGKIFLPDVVVTDKINRYIKKYYHYYAIHKYKTIKITLSSHFLSKRLRQIELNYIIKRMNDFHTLVEATKEAYGNKYIFKIIKRIIKTNKNKQVENTNHIVSLVDATKYYLTDGYAFKALSEANITINRGEFVVIIGPSGSGKTTLLNLISGLDNATFGDVIVNNTNLTGLNAEQLTTFRRENIGYVFQQYGLLPNLTVKENIEIGANLSKQGYKSEEIDELMKSVDIYEQRNKYPRELSGGQQQRVSVVRSLAKKPTIIFGDEPTGAVDENMSKQIMQMFVDVNKKFKTTIIIVTHNPILVGLASTVIHVANGKISKVEHNNNIKSVKQLKWAS